MVTPAVTTAVPFNLFSISAGSGAEFPYSAIGFTPTSMGNKNEAFVG